MTFIKQVPHCLKYTCQSDPDWRIHGTGSIINFSNSIFNNYAIYCWLEVCSYKKELSFFPPRRICFLLGAQCTKELCLSYLLFLIRVGSVDSIRLIRLGRSIVLKKKYIYKKPSRKLELFSWLISDPVKKYKRNNFCLCFWKSEEKKEANNTKQFLNN
jgi:hypothetical protein